MKVVSEQLGHSSLAITYTSVLPAIAQAAAEAVAGIVPRTRPAGHLHGSDAVALADGYLSAQKEAEMNAKKRRPAAKPQVAGGAPSGTRTPNPLIKSPE